MASGTDGGSGLLSKMLAVKVHTHPIAVHFSNGLIPVSFAFLILFWITKSDKMEIVAFATLVTGTLGSILAIGTGLIDWKKNYRGNWAPVFKKKLTAGILAVVVGAIACAIRFQQPDLLYSVSVLAVVYVVLNVVSLGCVTFAGYLGGNLVFP